MGDFFVYLTFWLYLCMRFTILMYNTVMKRIVLLAIAAFVLFACKEHNTPANIKNGELTGEFSISATRKVHFAQGNLQYCASKNTWRFAEHQYTFIGEGNQSISSSYDGWIDLFGWGTGDKPTTNSIGNSEDYASFTDWGTNPISNGGNAANQWRTLTKEEWVYLFQARSKASDLFGMGSVNGVNGMIILPDDWATPAGISFMPSIQKGLQNLGIHYQNEEKNNFSHNTYTLKQWSAMESAGAVFLPAAGGRFGSDPYCIGENGYYWSATVDEYTDYFAHLMYFDSEFLFPQGYTGCYRGLSVRLVK